MVKLSKRLQAIADLVTKGNRVADIGTDHAYIPIYLVKEGRIPSAVAMDVNEGPLLRARNHIASEHLEDCIRTKLSDGFASLLPGEADTGVIAGMGGALMIKILSEGETKVQGLKELILQPQSETSGVRKYIRTHGMYISQEDMVEEDGKYYPMMQVKICSEERSAVSDPEEKHRMLEDAFGPELMKNSHPVLIQWLKREKQIVTEILENLPRQSHTEARRQELLQKMEEISQVLMEISPKL